MTDRVLTAMLAMQRQSWEQGVAAHAALDLGRHDLALLLAEAAVVRQAADGRLGDVDGEDGAVNGAACGEAVLAAGFADAAHRQLAWLAERAPRAADGTLFHLLGRREVWADTVYMVVPFLVLAGRADLAVRQIDGHRRRLCRDGLYSAIWSEDTGSLRRPDRWGGASGWVVAGIARALRLAPSLPRRRSGGARTRGAGRLPRPPARRRAVPRCAGRPVDVRGDQRRADVRRTRPWWAPRTDGLHRPMRTSAGIWRRPRPRR